jgi:hypothetical protein
MHLKVFVKLKKTLKTRGLDEKTQKTLKNPKKQKKQKNKKTHWAGFFFKNRVFSNHDFKRLLVFEKVGCC